MKVNGMAEVLAGLLLLFRRTTTIGAILSACVFSFVVMMDFCFNVPVRLLASHLLIISLFLALGDGRRLLNIFFLNKPTNTILYVPLVDHRGWRKALVSLQFVIAVSLLYTTISYAVQAEKQYGQSAPHVPLYGVYNTAWFIKNGDTLPALQTDSTRWKQLVIDGGSWKQSGIIQLNTDKKTNYNIHADTIKQTLTIQSLPDSNENYLLNYFKPDADHLLLKGLWKKDSIEVLMNRYDLNNYLLHREKFKWIGN
jgi:hypothetical protein